MNWTPIKKAAIKAAETLGHRVNGFSSQRKSPWVKTASCESCYGCCWIAYTPTRGFGAGGRILKYRCGTKEATGVL